MTKPGLGVLTGAVLGMVDGMSAWTYPEARAMILFIVISSTIKGVLTGAATGWLARRWRSLPGGIAAGIAIGFVLSTLAALPTRSEDPSHYYDIVLPGMLLGAIVGFVTQRYPKPGVAARGRQAPGLLLLLLLVPAMVAGAQPAPPTDPFERIAFMLGRWEGTAEGQPGVGTVQRNYARVLSSRFVHSESKVTYPAQEKNPKGEVHEDQGWFSFDRARKRLVLRQFHIEGFVNQYVEEVGPPSGSLVFISEAIENIPAGWRARETYIVRGPDAFEEVFELAEAGKELEVYSRILLKRVK